MVWGSKTSISQSCSIGTPLAITNKSRNEKLKYEYYDTVECDGVESIDILQYANLKTIGILLLGFERIQ